MDLETHIKEKLKDLEKLINAKFDANADEHRILHDELNKKASKWVQLVVGGGMAVVLTWGLKQLLELISTAHAIFF